MIQRNVLIEKWVLEAIDGYMRLNNPMGLVDDFIERIVSVTKYNHNFLFSSYDFLAAGYRLLYASNQLEFVWDGRSQLTKYSEEWEVQFSHWIHGLSFQDSINRSIIKACVLKEDSTFSLLEKNFTRLVLTHVKLRWDGRSRKLVRSAA